MKLIGIENAVAAYLERSRDELIVNSEDLCLIAMNQVRYQAELLHDFGFSRKLVTVAVNGVTGGSLENAVVLGTNTTATVKTIVDVGLLDEAGNIVPIEWTTAEDSFRRIRGDNYRAIPRYPTDNEASSIGGQGRFTFHGDRVNIFPLNTDRNYTLVIDAYTFENEWTQDHVDAETNDDTIVTSPIWQTKGSQFILWGTLIHLNNLYKQFVFRQEGNLPPPKDLKDEGLQNLVSWDIFKYEQHRRHDRG